MPVLESAVLKLVAEAVVVAKHHVDGLLQERVVDIDQRIKLSVCLLGYQAEGHGAH